MINEDARYSRLVVDQDDPNGHITLSRFGLSISNDVSEYDELVRTLDAVRPSIARRLSIKAYHRDYGIHDHADDDPLDIVTLHPKENIIEGGPVRTWMRKYVNHSIRDIFGLNIWEFFDSPYNEVLFMLELAESKVTQNTIQANKLNSEFIGMK